MKKTIFKGLFVITAVLTKRKKTIFKGLFVITAVLTLSYVFYDEFHKGQQPLDTLDIGFEVSVTDTYVNPDYVYVTHPSIPSKILIYIGPESNRDDNIEKANRDDRINSIVRLGFWFYLLAVFALFIRTIDDDDGHGGAAGKDIKED